MKSMLVFLAIAGVVAMLALPLVLALVVIIVGVAVVEALRAHAARKNRGDRS